MDGDSTSLDTKPETQRNTSAAAKYIGLTDESQGDPPSSKVSALKQYIEKDVLAADLKWSLFVAACHSYRYDSCVKPFPPQFVQNNTKNIDALRDVIDATPPFSTLIRYLKDPQKIQQYQQVIDVVHWALFSTKDIKLATVPKSKFNEVLGQADYELSVQMPNHIFEVVTGSNVSSEAKWIQLAEGKKTMFAFHGSRLENFHSIIHHGLQQHMNKTSLFGKGIYLSSEPSVSLPYSTAGYTWGRSELGRELSCIALCEVIDHPDTKCQTRESDRSRSVMKGSIGGEVPPKYYVVQNNEVVRIRYLLVYTKKTSLRTSNGTVVSWIARHKMFILVLGYVVLLAGIGLSNSSAAQKFNRMLQKKFGW